MRGKCPCGCALNFDKKAIEGLGFSTKKAVEYIKAHPEEAISRFLIEQYMKDFHRAVDRAFSRKQNPELYMKMMASVEKFAMYKAARFTSQAQKLLKEDKGETERAKFILDLGAHWQITENNTVVTRARTAQQFDSFKKSAEVFPNLRWLQTMSVSPRPEHEALVGRVWAKDDPFWDTHSPGQEWNCKCDVEETDEPVTEGNREVEGEMAPIPQGLEGNPGRTGEIFTKRAPYIFGAKEKVKEDCFDSYRDWLIEEVERRGILGEVIGKAGSEFGVSLLFVKEWIERFRAKDDYAGARAVLDMEVLRKKV